MDHAQLMISQPCSQDRLSRYYARMSGLQSNITVNESVSLGEGSYGKVHPGILNSTEDCVVKVRSGTCCIVPKYVQQVLLVHCTLISLWLL